MENKIYFEIKNKYLAEGMAFLGFKYQKFGFGKDTKYSFKDDKQIHKAMKYLIDYKKELNLKY